LLAVVLFAMQKLHEFFMCVCLSVTLTLYYSLPWNTVSEINQMKKKIYYSKFSYNLRAFKLLVYHIVTLSETP